MATCERNYALSLIRAIALLFVFLCHVLQQSRVPIVGDYFSVCVQMFLVLSGWLYGNRPLDTPRSKWNFVRRNFGKILLDYYVYLLLFALPLYALLKPGSVNRDSLFGVLTCSSTIGGIHHLWYIPYILACYLLTPLLSDLRVLLGERSNRNPWRLAAAFAGAAAGVQVLIYAFHDYFIGAWLLCYGVGYFARSWWPALSPRGRKGGMALLISATLIANLVKHVCKYMLKLPLTGLKGELLNLEYLYAQALLGICLFATLYLWLRRLPLGRHAWARRFLTQADRYSYDIYLTHMIFVKGILSLIGLTRSWPANLLVIVVISGVCGIVLYKVSQWIRTLILRMGDRNRATACR